MRLKELVKSQKFFLDVVHSNPSLSTGLFLEMPEAKIFVEKTAHRLQAYRTAYYARISSVFSETIFNLASCLFGKEIIKSFLIDYFYKNPSPAEMIESVRGFANYLDTQEEIKECPFVPDFIKVCISINDILSAKNPEESLLLENTSEIPNPSKIFLQEDHIFIKSQWPVYQMYCTAKELNDMIECEAEKKNGSGYNFEKEREERLVSIINKEESILFLKSTPWSLESILVPNEFISIAENLNIGMSLEDSIGNAIIDEETFDTQKLSNWMSLLTKNKAFIKRI
jgi:hypothetical protein